MPECDWYNNIKGVSSRGNMDQYATECADMVGFKGSGLDVSDGRLVSEGNRYWRVGRPLGENSRLVISRP